LLGALTSTYGKGTLKGQRALEFSLMVEVIDLTFDSPPPPQRFTQTQHVPVIIDLTGDDDAAPANAPAPAPVPAPLEKKLPQALDRFVRALCLNERAAQPLSYPLHGSTQLDGEFPESSPYYQLPVHKRSQVLALAVLDGAPQGLGPGSSISIFKILKFLDKRQIPFEGNHCLVEELERLQVQVVKWFIESRCSTSSSSPHLDPFVLLHLVAQRLEKCQRMNVAELKLAIFDVASRLFDVCACSQSGRLFVMNNEPLRDQATYGKAIASKKARDSAIKRQILTKNKELQDEYNAALALLLRQDPQTSEDRLCKAISWILSDVPGIPTTKLSLLLRYYATQQHQKADDHLYCAIASRLSTSDGGHTPNSGLTRPGNGPIDRILNFLHHS